MNFIQMCNNHKAREQGIFVEDKKEEGIAVSVKMMVVSSEYISLLEDWEV